MWGIICKISIVTRLPNLKEKAFEPCVRVVASDERREYDKREYSEY